MRSVSIHVESTVIEHEKYLFLFAHPDDDVFVVGTMRMLLDRGKEVHGVWVTSGEARKPAALREAELKSAMAVVGVESIHLLRLPNRGLLSVLDPAADLVAQILDRTNPDCVVTTAYEGGHIDHDAVNFIAFKALDRCGSAARLFEFPLYNRSGHFYRWWWKINRFPEDHQDVRYVRLTEDAIRRKHLAMKAYASQRRDMIPFRLVLTKQRLLSQGEPYRPCPGDRDFTVPPHQGRLNYEGWLNSPKTVTFSDFRNAVTQLV